MSTKPKPGAKRKPVVSISVVILVSRPVEQWDANDREQVVQQFRSFVETVQTVQSQAQRLQ
jgi:hypothetical protein